MLETCEDRTVPTAVVTVETLAHAYEGGASALVQFTRSDTSGSLFVSYSIGGTATPSVDHDKSSTGIVSFANGVATANLTITADDDSESEATETIIVTIEPDSGYTIGGWGYTTAYIYDNDAQIVTVSPEDAGEAGDPGRFRFHRIGDLSGSITVNFTVGGTATEGVDYNSIGTSVNLAAWASFADVVITAIPDNLVEGSEYALATLASGTGYSIGSPNYAAVFIYDGTPTATADEFGGDEDDEINGNVLTNDTDPNEDTLTATVVNGTWFGTLTLNPNGSFTYTPNENFYGTDVFTYLVSNTTGGTNTATVTLTVAPIDDDPVIDDQELSILSYLPDDTIIGYAFGYDPDWEQTLTYSITAGNGDGAFAINSTTGVITIADACALDFDTNPVYSLTIQVSDNGTTPRTDTATFEISMADFIAEEVHTEAERIELLNEGYDFIQFLFYGESFNYGLSTFTANGPTTTAIENLDIMIDTAPLILDAIIVYDSVIFAPAARAYNLAMANVMFDIMVEATVGAIHAINTAKELARYSELDAFRLEGIDALMRELAGYFRQVQTRLTMAKEATENALTTLSQGNYPGPGDEVVELKFDTAILNFNIAYARLNALIAESQGFWVLADEEHEDWPGSTVDGEVTVQVLNGIAFDIIASLNSIAPNPNSLVGQFSGEANEVYGWGVDLETLYDTDPLDNDYNVAKSHYFGGWPIGEDEEEGLSFLFGQVNPNASAFPNDTDEDDIYDNYGVLGFIFGELDILNVRTFEAFEFIHEFTVEIEEQQVPIQDYLRFTGLRSYLSKTFSQTEYLQQIVAGASNMEEPDPEDPAYDVQLQLFRGLQGQFDDFNAALTDASLGHLLSGLASVVALYDFVLDGDDIDNEENDEGAYLGIRDYSYLFTTALNRLNT